MERNTVETKPPTLSVVIPVYNEIKTLEIILNRALAVEVNKEIVLVDDGSTDGTREAIARYAASHPNVRAFYREKNGGKGAAVQIGIKEARGDIIIIQDADLEYSPEDYPALIKPILDGVADVVFGSRFLGPHRVFMFWHYAANKFLTFFANLLYNTMLTDMEVGHKAFRRTVFDEIKIRSDGFDFEPEVTAKVFKRGYRVFEVPITYSGRTYAEGKKITWKDAVYAIIAIIRFRFFE